MAKRPYIKRVSILGGEPLTDENLQDVLNLVNKIRLSFGETKTIWMYSGYTWEEIWTPQKRINTSSQNVSGWTIEQSIRQDILKQCDVFVDGRYVDSQKDITLLWRGSSNQRVIDAQKSLKENKVILYAN